jgi:hypothetical protein
MKKLKVKKTNKCETNETTPTNLEELKKSDYCMMYFAKGCKNKRLSRGLCRNHYNMVYNRVRLGYVTWNKVEAQLHSMPSQKASWKDTFGDL